jgi:restriction system protein
MLWPTLVAVRENGDSGTNAEIAERVIALEGFSEEQQAVPDSKGRGSLIAYRLAWCRSHLKGMGLLTNSEQGVWSTTELGRKVTQDEIPNLHAAFRAQLRKKDKDTDEEETQGESEETSAWKEALLAALKRLQPDQFERLAKRLLREAGFVSVKVTGKSGDGGIDGVGVYRLSLVTFPVFFQCKRYKDTVNPHDVRDFRGAMSGRGDRGLLITSGTFTTEARKEANRDGAPPVDLIDGDELCDLLKQYELGVARTVREVEDVALTPEFFADL